MPVYEYRCAKGHDYEKTEGFSAPTEQKCIVCGAKAKRQISKPAVIFKGSGFYSTDNRRSTSSSASETSSSDTKSDSTPAASTSDNGHSHGDGGHSHGASEKPAKSSKKSDSKAD
ncbi:MAG: FmdB family zinc ribbon protein [Chloroflexota bacterium]